MTYSLIKLSCCWWALALEISIWERHFTKVLFSISISYNPINAPITVIHQVKHSRNDELGQENDRNKDVRHKT